MGNTLTGVSEIDLGNFVLAKDDIENSITRCWNNPDGISPEGIAYLKSVAFERKLTVVLDLTYEGG